MTGQDRPTSADDGHDRRWTGPPPATSRIGEVEERIGAFEERLGERIEDRLDGQDDSRFDRLEQRAIEAELATGVREETIEEAKRSVLRRIGRITLGSVVLLAGLVMLIFPGPGWLAIFAGLVLLSRDVPFAARLVEPVRKRLPQDEDGKLPTSAIVSMVAMGVVFVAASVWWFLLR